ncbi:MAG: 3-dehydroquinate synthase family protein [Planctomycetota bacterium]
MSDWRLALRFPPLPGARTDILVGRGNLGSLGREVRRRIPADAAFVVTHPALRRRFGAAVARGLKAGGVRAVAFGEFPAGERFKTVETWARLLRRIAAFDRGERRRLVVGTLGGGVAGDLGGFVAATYRRGVPFFQVPTSLLANVDAAVGGKVAVDLIAKNQVGAFHQPFLVLVDLETLRTLPPAEVRSALAEVAKYGVIADARILDLLERETNRILAKDPDVLGRIVRRSYEIKASFVRSDERDTRGIRAALNFGHTFGHALEQVLGFRWRHGEAVAVGMLMASDLEASMAGRAPDYRARLETILARLGLPTRAPDVEPRKVLEAMRHDKKFVSGRNRFVLSSRAGSFRLAEGVPWPLVRKAVEGRLGRAERSP